jgi:hypothetical protein
MKLVQAGNSAMIDRYIGYYQPYAASREALDRDPAIRQEVRTAQGLANQISLQRQGRIEPDATMQEAPREIVMASRYRSGVRQRVPAAR